MEKNDLPAMPLPHGLEEYEPVPFSIEAPQLVTFANSSSTSTADNVHPLVPLRLGDSCDPEKAVGRLGTGSPAVMMKRRPLHPAIVGRRSAIHGATVMIILLLCGAAFAVGHHAYNRSLAGYPVDTPSNIAYWYSITSQMLALRVQTVFVFLTKTFFTATVSMAFMQRFWITANRKAMRLQGLDAMYSAINDPFALFTWDFVRNAKLLALLAIVAWLVPLASIPAPSSLTVVNKPTSDLVSCMVPHVDLSDKDLDIYAYRDSLGFFQSSTPSIQAMAIQALSRGSYVGWDSPCGPNCTYSTSFHAPWYNCSDPEVMEGYDLVLKWAAVDSQSMTQDNLTVEFADGSNTPYGPEIHNTTCLAWNATYGISVNYRNGVQDVFIEGIAVQNPIALGPILYGEGTIPTWNYPQLSNSAGVKDAFARLLAGFLDDGPTSGYYVNATMVGYSTMVVHNTSIYFPDVPWGVQSLSQNVSLSLMASSPASPINTTCVVTGTEVVWHYNPMPLWASYGSIALVSLTAVCIGLYSMIVLGGAGNRSFSLLLATTRNPELDEVFAAGSGNKGRTMLMKDRLRYEALDDGDAGFAFRIVKNSNEQ